MGGSSWFYECSIQGINCYVGYVNDNFYSIEFSLYSCMSQESIDARHDVNFGILSSYMTCFLTPLHQIRPILGEPDGIIQ